MWSRTNLVPPGGMMANETGFGRGCQARRRVELLLTPRRIHVPPAPWILDLAPSRSIFGSDVIRSCGYLAKPTGNVEHIRRLRNPGQTLAELAHDVLPFGNRRPEMSSTHGQITVMQIIWFYT